MSEAQTVGPLYSVPQAAFAAQISPFVAAQATFAPSGRTINQRAAEVVNLKDFVLATDGGDAALAFNRMFAYVRSIISQAGGASLRVEVPNDFYFCNSSVQATGINGSPGSAFANSAVGCVIHFNGATLVGCFNGGIVFDYFGSNFLKVFDLNVTNGGSIAGRSGIPGIGIAGGISGVGNAGISNNHEFYNCASIGNFSLSCEYAIGTETSAWYNPRFYNSSPNAGTFCHIADGQNHFGVSSTALPMTLPVDTPISFNSLLMIQPDFRHSGGGQARWLGATSAHRNIGGYFAVAAALPATVLWQSQSTGGGVANIDLYDDVHVETGTCTDVYIIAGPQVAPPLYGLTYIDPGPKVSNSIFKCDPSITGSVYASDVKVKLVAYASGSLKMWDNAAKWDWFGDISVPNGGSLCATLPGAFSGRLAIGHTENITANNLRFTGTLQGGTYAAGAVAQVGYLTITDAGGTPRRLLVG